VALREVRRNFIDLLLATLWNCMRIPSCTIELGPMHEVHPDCRDAALVAIHNLLVHAEMIEGHLKPISQVPVVRFPEPHRYLEYPLANGTGIVDFVTPLASRFEKGEKLAVIRKIDGTFVSNVNNELDVGGWMMAWEGITVLPGQKLGLVAIPDGENPKVVKWATVLAKIKEKDS